VEVGINLHQVDAAIGDSAAEEVVELRDAGGDGLLEAIERFLEEYFGSREEMDESLSCIQGLRSLYHYRNCVGWLWWLNEDPRTGLDAVGMAYFNRILAEL